MEVLFMVTEHSNSAMWDKDSSINILKNKIKIFDMRQRDCVTARKKL